MKSRKIVVQVEGGLGNHIFQYAAGKFLAEKTQSQLVINTSRIGHGMTNHGYYLDLIFQDFNKIGDIGRGRVLTKLFSFKERGIGYLSRKNNFMRKLVLKFFRIYYASGIGFESKFLRLDSPVEIKGYFQTWRYAKSLISKDLIHPNLISKSDWFRNLEELAATVKPVVVHVRRGDYRVLKDNFGLLSKSYYLRALETLPNHLKSQEIWVFSNEIESARLMFEDFKNFKIRFISEPPASNPAETLILMTLGSANVIANSTFSYWGAFLNTESEIVIAPNKWYKSMEDPEDLIPPNWVRVKSDWE